jgi:hypothetical protein
MAKIRVHEKALAHLSRGLYRSPASALRELVSNAWDADAKVVRVDTNYPNFLQVSVEDNGEGFTLPEFEAMMQGGIGNSPKRPQATTTATGRPIIGRLGIGMLGIAQICLGFRIISKTREGAGFAAQIHLYDLLKERLDRNDPEVTRDEASMKEVDVGEYTVDKSFNLSDARFGTTVIANDVHPTFVRAFKESVRFEGFEKPTKSWKNALKIISGVRSLQELGDYWRLIWELAASCPIPYVDGRAIPNRLIWTEQKRLESFHFRVLVDGLELRKPVYLKGNKGGYTTTSIQRQTEKVYGKNLTFSGYIVVQEGAQLRPDELRGILIRIKNVGIGYYDPSMLDYRINQGPRSRWLTGEIFVEEGLEDALNIDRDSFNRFHPEFRALQEHVHSVLSDKVFPVVYKKITVRSTERHQERERHRTVALKETIAEATEQKVKLRSGPTVDDGHAPSVGVVEHADSIEITVPHADEVPTRKANRQLAASILAIYEVAAREKTRTKQQQLFTELLLKLLARW